MRCRTIGHAAWLGLMLLGMAHAQSAAPSVATTSSAEASEETTDPASSPEALARRERTEAILRKEGVPLNKDLPTIEDEASSKRRTAEAVANRAVALYIVSCRAEGLDEAATQRLIAEWQVAGHLTPNERVFLGNPAPSSQDRAQFTWRYECSWVLLWALGFVDKLEGPRVQSDPAAVARIILDGGRARFFKAAKLRPQAELLDAADRIYRYRWALVDARINGKPAPAGLNDDVAVEWHHALNWVIGYDGAEWDDISTDT
jgi:hypothetical protein